MHAWLGTERWLERAFQLRLTEILARVEDETTDPCLDAFEGWRMGHDGERLRLEFDGQRTQTVDGGTPARNQQEGFAGCGSDSSRFLRTVHGEEEADGGDDGGR